MFNNYRMEEVCLFTPLLIDVVCEWRHMYVDLACVSPPQCAPGGCLIELCIQLSIIMLGKQLIQNNIFEIGIP